MNPLRKSFAVALPMYNEEECAERSVRALFETLDELPNPNSIIVVNDGSRDRTGPIVERLKREYRRLTLISHEKNRGYGGAIKSAYDYAARAGIDYVLFMDADLTQHPKYIRRFLPHIDAGVDVIKASRYIDEGRVEGVPLWRVVISRVGNGLARRLYRLPIRDYTNGFRAVKTDLSRRFRLESNAFDLLMEELYQARYLGASFAEVPYVLTARAEGDGKSTFSYRPRVLYKYFRFGVKSFLNIRPQGVEREAAPHSRPLRRAA